MKTKDEHCSYCGSLFNTQSIFVDNSKYPKQCVSCGNTVYNNPVPVVVSLVFVVDNNRLGLLVIKRNTEPQKDKWAFPGGYLEVGETVAQGAARELLEETGINLNPQHFMLADIKNASNGNLIIFSDYMALEFTKIIFTPTAEASELKVIFSPEELAFPSHTEMAKEIFNELSSNEQIYSKAVYNPKLSN